MRSWSARFRSCSALAGPGSDSATPLLTMGGCMLFGALLKHVVERGSLRVIDARGRSWTFGDGTGRPLTVRLHDRGLHLGLAINPYLRLGEAYMDGTLTIDAPGDIYDLLDLVLGNLGTSYP